MSEELESLIKAACEKTKPGTIARHDALAAIRWQLRSDDGLTAGLNDAGTCLLCVDGDPRILTFDGRDNHTAKRAFYSALTETDLEIVLV